MYERHLADAVRSALADTPVTLLQGARQVGKSTLAQQSAWSANVGPRLVKAPKVLVPDTGLAAYLLNLPVGRLAENRTSVAESSRGSRDGPRASRMQYATNLAYEGVS